MTKQEKLEQRITDLLEVMHMTSKQTDEQVKKMFSSTSKKYVLYNSSFALIKMIGEMK